VSADQAKLARVEFVGVPLDPLSMADTMVLLRSMIEEGSPHRHVALNAAKVVMAQDVPELAEVVRTADVVSADGVPIVWAGRLLGHNVPGRVNGTDLMEGLLELAAGEKWPVYFLGATEAVLGQAVEVARMRYAGLIVAGWHHGYWDPDEELDVVDAIAQSGAKILFIGIPTPRKEMYAAQHLGALGVPLIVGVGGSLDVLAGLVPRAPRWMQRSGLEWFYRLLREPRRLMRRYAVGNTRFIILIARAWWQTRRAGTTGPRTVPTSSE
jgi:N-acetylglucosaminyldiphosphoundecaprenol N-acetyl-beta-D-mannosaminyltransferase